MVQAIVLAAGESSRFLPLSEDRHKSLVKILGKTIVEHTIAAIQAAGISDILVVVSPRDEKQFSGLLQGKATLVVQKEAKGMGDAVLQCERKIKDNFFVLNADRFDCTQLLEEILQKAKETGADMVVASTKTEQPWKYGMLTIKDGFAKKVTEKPKKGEEPSNDKIVGIYLLPKNFLTYYKKCTVHTYAYEDALSMYMEKHKVPIVFREKEESSLKYSWDLLDVAKALLATAQFQRDATAQVAKTAIVDSNVTLGKNVKVYDYAIVKGPAWIGDNSVVGTHALVRDGTVIGENCSLGMNTEVTRSIFLDGATIHSGFVGDSVIGEKVKIGAGFITANRRLDRGEILPIVKNEKTSTKKTSLGTIVGHRTAIGIMSSTMPGTIVGCDCIIGSNTHVKGTIDSNAKVYTQSEQIIEKKK